MAEVFQGYKKFEDMRAELQAEIEKSDAEAKLMVERMQKMQQEMVESKAGTWQCSVRTGRKSSAGRQGRIRSLPRRNTA